MSTIAEGLSRVVPGIEVCGTSDLAIGRRKFSGNSQRWLKNAFLHHGTILYDYDLPRISRLLKFPSRQPEYRLDRPHQHFLGNLACSRSDVMYRLSQAFLAISEKLEPTVMKRANDLADVKYDSDRWIRDR
jgi:lipoate-protein ligase A